MTDPHPQVHLDQHGRIVVEGTDSADNIHISQRTTKGKQDGVVVSVSDQFGHEIGHYAFTDKEASNGLSVEGGEGSDTITVDKNVTYDAYLEGGDGHDTIQGGGGFNIISGGKGDDTLRGGSGYNILLGDEGNDDLHAGKGTREIYGGEGSDKEYGNTGPIRLHVDSDDTYFDPGTGTGKEIEFD